MTHIVASMVENGLSKVAREFLLSSVSRKEDHDCGKPAWPPLPEPQMALPIIIAFILGDASQMVVPTSKKVTQRM